MPARDRLRWFRWNPQDHIPDPALQAMRREERGAYTDVLCRALVGQPDAADERAFNEDVAHLDTASLIRERRRLMLATLLISEGRAPSWAPWASERLVMIERELEGRRRAR